MLPENVRVQDETGEHERFLGVMQELFDMCYGIADRTLDIIDPDFAPIEAVEQMLLDLGNPFDFLELTEREKRILVQTLLAIYKTKGTGPGIVNALNFFLGIDVQIRVYAWAPYGIGEAIIGETLVLGSSEQSDLYTFEVVVEVFLTDTERKNLRAIVEYMKVAHEHWRLIEPTPPVNIDHWQLDFSQLDVETFLH
jgi:phage tail-like protein